MYTGIVQNTAKIVDVILKNGLTTFVVKFNESLLTNLKIGASVAIDGVCFTVTSINQENVSFDAMQETLDKTTVKYLAPSGIVNVERSAKYGDEIGGHVLSGHIDGLAKIVDIETPKNNCIITFECPQELMKYVFPKGFIAINGASLTVVETENKETFSVYLIPETLRATTFKLKKVGDYVNIEIDRQTQIIVDTLERLLTKSYINELLK